MLAKSAIVAWLYAMIVFLAGCVLGTLRETAAVPVLGQVVAIWIELPVMTLICYQAAARLLVRGTDSRAVGLLAVPILLLFEFALGRAVRGTTSVEACLLQQEGGVLALTLAGFAILAAMPTVAARRIGRPGHRAATARAWARSPRGATRQRR